jgi:hypothetical protein
MDNYATHQRIEVRDWLAANPRITTHFTPTSGSWLNLVEVWFGIIERQAIRRGTFNSVRDLNAKIRAFVTGWNDRRYPFVWTKTADDILKKANRQTTSNTDIRRWCNRRCGGRGHRLGVWRRRRVVVLAHGDSVTDDADYGTHNSSLASTSGSFPRCLRSRGRLPAQRG